MKQRRLVMIARNKVENYERDLQELEDELGQEISELEVKFDATRIALEPEPIKPYKKDIDVRVMSLLWLPCNDDGQPVW